MCHHYSRNYISCECPSASPSGWQFLLTDVSTTWRHITSLPSSIGWATLVTGRQHLRLHRPCSMFLALNTWPSVAVPSVQLQLVCGTVCQRQCSLLNHWIFFDAAWKLNCLHVLTTVERLLLCDSLSLSRSFLLWLQAWSLLIMMLLWHSFLIIILIIIKTPPNYIYFWYFDLRQRPLSVEVCTTIKLWL